MKIQEVDLIYIPGQRITSQKQSGRKNYSHRERTKNGVADYNGSGFKQELIPSKLKISAIDENGNEIFEDIKDQILESFNRQKLTESFVNKLEDRLNNIPEIVCEKSSSGNLVLSESTLQQIKKKIK